jgi:hypothetical protein
LEKQLDSFNRSQEMFDSTMGWRFINKQLAALASSI